MVLKYLQCTYDYTRLLYGNGTCPSESVCVYFEANKNHPSRTLHEIKYINDQQMFIPRQTTRAAYKCLFLILWHQSWCCSIRIIIIYSRGFRAAKTCQASPEIRSFDTTFCLHLYLFQNIRLNGRERGRRKYYELIFQSIVFRFWTKRKMYWFYKNLQVNNNFFNC